MMTDKKTFGKINEQAFPLDRLPRWKPGEGYSGLAFQRQKPVVVGDVWTGRGSGVMTDHYIEYFLGAKSEVAAPLIIGETVLGVLDVESDTLDHYITDYVDWIEFLARQAAFALSVIDRAAKTRVELAMADLSRQVDDAITDMRARTLATSGAPPIERVLRIQDMRQTALNDILHAMCDLTGAWVGRFLVELNVYRLDDTLDTERGRLFYLASSDEQETTDQENRFFGFDRGLSSVAFMQAKSLVFNSADKREAEFPGRYFDATGRVSLSNIFQTVLEGTRVTGVLNLECETEGAFTPELILACETAGNLITKLMTGARLRVDTILREMLRDFDFEIMRRQSSDLLTFMDLALERAARLTIVTQGAGLGVIFHLRPTLGGALPSIERHYWRDFSDPNARTTAMEYPHIPIEYRIFQEAISLQRPVVILDRRQQPNEERRAEPWPSTMRSIIAVPLLSPSPTGAGKEVIGILALAHPEPAQFSEHDKSSLSLFSESIVYGMTTIALMQARTRLMEQLRFDVGRATTPASLAADAAVSGLDDAARAASPDLARQHLGEAYAAAVEMGRQVRLAQNITTWFLDLADDDLQPDPDESSAQTAADVMRGFQSAADAFAALYSKTITWSNPVGPQAPLAGDEETARLIAATLAQYLETALSAEATQAIAVSAQQRENTVVFSVHYDGPPIPEADRSDLFSIGVSASTLTSQDTPITSVQQGLFQVKRMADRLGWRAGYKYDEQQPSNILYLEAPQKLR